MDDQRLASSFRDPSGFLFRWDGAIYRQVNRVYGEDFDHLTGSGLYDALVDEGMLIPHIEVGRDYARSDQAYKVIKPEPIQFVAYPYEWCFGQMRDAALRTLEVQKRSLDYGMSLKDCSAYNIQFKNGKPVFIDTLSFEKYREGRPWIAYRQFCQHFLAPLALMRYRDVRLCQLFRVYLDGIPLDVASSLLPRRTLLSPALLLHIHAHARSQRHFANRPATGVSGRMGHRSLLGLIDSLESGVRKLKWRSEGTEWADYYDETNYSFEAFEHKKQIVAQFLQIIEPTVLWDLGANVGVFSRIASDLGIRTVAFDLDPAAVEKNYRECARRGETRILPLVVDVTNPTPSLGWANRERLSLVERGPAEAVMALALIHHLAISNNVPLDRIARFLGEICSGWLIVEFVPKTDSQVQRLLSMREDIFPDYTLAAFEREMDAYFQLRDSVSIRDSERTVYLMRRRRLR